MLNPVVIDKENTFLIEKVGLDLIGIGLIDLLRYRTFETETDNEKLNNLIAIRKTMSDEAYFKEPKFEYFVDVPIRPGDVVKESKEEIDPDIQVNKSLRLRFRNHLLRSKEFIDSQQVKDECIKLLIKMFGQLNVSELQKEVDKIGSKESRYLNPVLTSNGDKSLEDKHRYYCSDKLTDSVAEYMLADDLGYSIVMQKIMTDLTRGKNQDKLLLIQEIIPTHVTLELYTMAWAGNFTYDYDTITTEEKVKVLKYVRENFNIKLPGMDLILVKDMYENKDKINKTIREL